MTDNKFSNRLFRNVISARYFLGRSRAVLFDFIKFQIHYGIIGDYLYHLKSFRSNLKNKPQKEQTPCVSDEKTGLPNSISSRFCDELRTIKDCYKIDTDLFKKPPHIIILGSSIPSLEHTSSDLRLFSILKILLANNCKIDYVYCAKLPNHARYAKAFDGDIAFTHLALSQEDYLSFIANRNAKYVWITDLWRLDYVRFMAKLTETMKKQCSLKKQCSFATVIIDTIDFHFKEFYRKYELTNDQEDLRRANEFLKNEKTLYRAADTVVVVSEEEQRDIQNKLGHIAIFSIIPNIHEMLQPPRPYSKRTNMCFVGNFGNKHNVDAVTYFLEEIFESILRKNPQVEFHVLGHSSDKYRNIFHSPNVRVIGSLRDLHKALTYYKLFVCPMTYGAGMKGKVGGAIAAGVPVVTTSIGAEGFPVRDGQECFIADSPTEFAEKCNQCLEDPVLWHNFSVKSRLMIAEHFSPFAVAIKLKNLLSD